MHFIPIQNKIVDLEHDCQIYETAIQRRINELQFILCLCIPIISPKVRLYEYSYSRLPCMDACQVIACLGKRS